MAASPTTCTVTVTLIDGIMGVTEVIMGGKRALVCGYVYVEIRFCRQSCLASMVAVELTRLAGLVEASKESD